MDLMGYIASLFIGLSLGLIGGGGSILTVPVMVYLFRVSPVMATAYSLFIVGSTSLVGAVPKYRQGLVNLKTAFIFGAPSIAAVFATRKFLVPHIPQHIGTIAGVEISRNLLTMLLFAMLMVLASFSMIREKHSAAVKDNALNQKMNHPTILAEGILVGALTGLVGAGGGFMIIPALVLLTKLPMKQAIGTSLLIIAANSLIGFMGDQFHHEMNWELLLSVTGLAMIGIFIGNWLSTKIDGTKLKKGFGWFVLFMGIYIILKETLFAA